MINRNKFRDIKRMDRKQLEDFIVSVYNDGFEKGKDEASANQLSSTDISVAIRRIKGIGSVKADEIMNVIHDLQHKELGV